MQHTVEADIVKDAGLAYNEIEGGRDREITCPVCRDYGRGIAAEASFNNNQRVKFLRKTIQRHMEMDAHAKALTAMDKERTRNQRLCHVGLIIGRTSLQIMREGCNYLTFEGKLHNLHLAGFDIGSLSHSRELIRAFVGSMITLMDLII
jgi:hypothetical protein